MGGLRSGWGRCRAGWGSAASASAPSTEQRGVPAGLTNSDPEQGVDVGGGRTHLTLQPDEEGDAGEAFDSQGVAQRRVAAHLTETSPTLSQRAKNVEPLKTQNSTGRGFYLQAEVDDVGHVRGDDGHFDLHELYKNLHGFSGLVLHTHKDPGVHTDRTAEEQSGKLRP